MSAERPFKLPDVGSIDPNRLGLLTFSLTFIKHFNIILNKVYMVVIIRNKVRNLIIYILIIVKVGIVLVE